jgi:hypothetical protein
MARYLLAPSLVPITIQRCWPKCEMRMAISSEHFSHQLSGYDDIRDDFPILCLVKTSSGYKKTLIEEIFKNLLGYSLQKLNQRKFLEDNNQY